MPKRLLRSVIDYNDTLTQDNLAANFRRLISVGMEWTRPVDQRIYTFVYGYFQQQHELPGVQTLRDFFGDDIEVVERLKDVEGAESYTRTNFAHLAQSLVSDQNRIKANALIKETGEIIHKGLTIGEGRNKKRLHGVRDAVLHFTQEVQDLLPTEYSDKTQGNLREDTEAGYEEYEEAKLNKDKAWGCFTGLNELDKVCHGHKRGELWVHAGYAGELKTSFALGWCYNLCTRYRRNVLYVSLEMPYRQLRRIVYTMHSANLKYRARGTEPLDYRKVRDGELTAEQEEFYKESLGDFDKNPDYSRFEVLSPDRDMSVADVKMHAELMHKQMEVGLIVIDHGELIESMKKHSNYTIEKNAVIRDCKKLAMHFNHGEGVPVLLLYQINRDGKDYADKNEGKYKMRALSYANECERSADVITTTYLNEEHRENGTTLVCNIKNRDNPIVASFLASVDFGCRRIQNFDSSVSSSSGMGVDEEDDLAQIANDMNATV